MREKGIMSGITMPGKNGATALSIMTLSITALGIMTFSKTINKMRYDTQHNDIQYNDAQNNDTRHIDIQHNKK
jgi:hypothetical protein